MTRTISVIITISLLMVGSLLYGQSISARAGGGLFLPLSDEFKVGGENSFQQVGPNINLASDVSFFDFLTTGLDLNYFSLTARGSAYSASVTSYGLNVGAYWMPASRIKLAASGGTGFYTLAFKGEKDLSYRNMYWQGGATVGYRVDPTFTITLGGAYRQYMLDWSQGQLMSGISAFASLDISLSSLFSSASGVRSEIKPTAPVFPLLYQSYASNQFGTIQIDNGEQAEIQNVRVEVSLGKYTSGPKLVANVPYIAHGGKQDVPLYANFNNQLATIIENTKLECEVSISYKFLGADRSVKSSGTINVNNRNALVWTDEQKLASFISPTDTATLEFTKFVAGLLRTRLRPEVDKNLQYGMGIFEGLRLAGIQYQPDPSTPYAEYHKDPAKQDYVQFPFQTLSYRSGDSDDLSVLYAASLESVGLTTAYMATPNEAIVLFKLVPGAADAKELYTDPTQLYYDKDEAWVPVRVSMIREGFMRAWQGGAQLIAAETSAGRKVTLNRLDDAWQKYPAMGVKDEETKIPKPVEQQVILAFTNTLNRFVVQEIGPRAQALLSEMKAGSTTPRQYNSLGLLYARYGLLEDAKAQFDKAAATEYVPALVNLGNIAIIEKRWEDAVGYFTRVLKQQPDNKTALSGLAQAKSELNDFAGADAAIFQLKQIDPIAAKPYEDLLVQTSESRGARASAADGDGKPVGWEGDGKK